VTDIANRRALSTPELTGAEWFKSSHSGGEQACVEVARLLDRTAIRDSKAGGNSVLVVSPLAFATFIAYLSQE
jgi:hypothetical protein